MNIINKCITIQYINTYLCIILSLYKSCKDHEAASNEKGNFIAAREDQTYSFLTCFFLQYLAGVWQTCIFNGCTWIQSIVDMPWEILNYKSSE